MDSQKSTTIFWYPRTGYGVEFLSGLAFSGTFRSWLVVMPSGLSAWRWGGRVPAAGFRNTRGPSSRGTRPTTLPVPEQTGGLIVAKVNFRDDHAARANTLLYLRKQVALEIEEIADQVICARLDTEGAVLENAHVRFHVEVRSRGAFAQHANGGCG